MGKYTSIHSDLIQKKINLLKTLQEKGEEHVTVDVDEILGILESLEELRKAVLQLAKG